MSKSKIDVKKFQNQVKFLLTEHDQDNLQQSINFVCYGFKADKIQNKGSGLIKNVSFYILDSDQSVLQWISQGKKKFNVSRIQLKDLKGIQTQYPNKLKSQNQQDTLGVLISDTYNLGLIFQNKQKRDLFLQGIQYFYLLSMGIIQEIPLQDKAEELANNIMTRVDKTGKRQLNLEDFKNALSSLQIKISDQKIKQQFEKYDKDGSGEIDQQELQLLIRDLTQKLELEDLFKKYCVSKTLEIENKDFEFKNYYRLMSKEELIIFFKKEQGEDLNLEKIQKLIEQNKDNFQNEQEQQFQDQVQKQWMSPDLISFFQFQQIIFNLSNQIHDPSKLVIYQDMNLPLTDYYINSSHNTYLLADQLKGDSSVQAYINSFQLGCRCVEIDIWDGPNNDPIVYHGHTLTSKIRFEDVVIAIREYGFVFSPYPLILSFENHCKENGQIEMAKYLKKYLSEFIYMVKEDSEFQKFYLSPEQLKNKIIIKGKGSLIKVLDAVFPNRQQIKKLGTYKKYNPDQFLNEIRNKSITDQVDFLNDSAVLVNYFTQPPPQRYSYIKFKSYFQDDDKLEMIENEDDGKEIEQEDQEIEGIMQLQQLFTMFGSHFSLDDGEKRSIWSISSVNESKIKNLYLKKEIEIIDWHKQYFSRIYPKGTRVDSSNYDPYFGFLAGSQIVALNVQTPDKSMLWNMGKFQENGSFNSGYVLKPSWMLSTCPKQDSKYSTFFCFVQTSVQLTIISAQFLQSQDPKNDSNNFLNPYVEISCKGTIQDTKSNKTFKTSTVQNNGFNPVWSNLMDPEERAQFQFSCPDHGQISFQVFSKNSISSDERIGFYSLHVNNIREGFRVIPLWNDKFTQIKNSFILVHVKINQYLAPNSLKNNPNQIYSKFNSLNTNLTLKKK